MHESNATLSPSRLIVTALAGALAVCSLGAPDALASPAIAVAEQAQAPRERRTELNLGMLAGGTDIGQDKRYTVGLQVEAGRRFGDLVLLGEYDYLALGKASSISRGSMSRFGVLARYSLMRTRGLPDSRGRRSPVSGDYWVELGAGLERIAWNQGGVVLRPDLAAGFGWQFNGVFGRKTARPRYYGPFVALRAHVARAPQSTMAMPATCSGPCDMATPPPGTDVSFFFHAGINWGR